MMAIVLMVLTGLVPAGPASAAPAGGSASISDAAPQPGESVTVRASGLLAGRETVIDYFPEGVRLAIVTVDADGRFSEEVQIPSNSYDGPKQVIVTALDSAGKFTRLHVDLVISGAPASAELSDMTLTPSQVVRLSGRRWAAGTTVAVLLFPEGNTLGPVTAGQDGRFSVDLQLPEVLVNGRHGIQVFGRSAKGGMANVKLFPSVIGGIGTAGRVEIPDYGDVGASSTSSSNAPARTTTTTVRAPVVVAPVDTGGSSAGLIGVMVICLLLLVIIAIGWLRTPGGRRWLRDRRPSGGGGRGASW